MMLNIIEVGRGCAKGLLIVLNLLSILTALCTLGFAAVDIKINQYAEHQSSGCYTGDVIIIVASLMLVAVATVGGLGAARDSVMLLNLYVVFVLIMVVLELLIAVYVSVQRYGLQFRVTEWIREDFYKNVTVFELDEHTQDWNELQNTYECCGLNGPEDYIALGQSIPVSCCSRAFSARSDNARKLMYKSCVDTAAYYKTGCEEEILDLLEADASYLIGVAVISFWFEGCGILLAMWISRQLRNSVQVYKNTVRY